MSLNLSCVQPNCIVAPCPSSICWDQTGKITTDPEAGKSPAVSVVYDASVIQKPAIVKRPLPESEKQAGQTGMSTTEKVLLAAAFVAVVYFIFK